MNLTVTLQIAEDGSVFSYGNSFFLGTIPTENPLVKSDQVGLVAALKGVSNVLGLQVSANAATTKPEEATEHYVIAGTTGAYQDLKACLVYFQTLEQTLSLSWSVETDLNDNWLLSYVDVSGVTEIYGVVNYVSDATYKV